MIRPLTALVLVLCAVVAVRALVAAVRGSRPPRDGVLVLEGLLLVQAAADGVSLLAGHAAAEPAVHVGYLLASVGLLPLLVPRLAAPDRASAAALVVGAAGVFVVCVRMWATWRTRA